MEISPSKSDDLSLHSQKIEKAFNFDVFCVSIKKSLSENVSDTEDIELESYLLAYEELQNFFLLLGPAFQFVAMDVKNKIKILQAYQKDEKLMSVSSKNFLTVKSMINYEREKNLLINPSYLSGSRTLLRLHRGLNFLRKFLGDLYTESNNAKLGPVARKVYDETLAEYHTWVVKNTARVAMQFLPNRAELLKKISNNDEEMLSNILAKFPEGLEAMNVAYDRVQKIYSDNSLLDLP